MLVLTRAKGEAIVIGDGIEVTVVEIKGDKVRLGIQAPVAVTVHRKEVWIAIRDANIAAAVSPPQELPGDLLKGKEGEGPGKPKAEGS